MFRIPGQETIPFHLIYVSMALVFGWRPWPLPMTCIVLAIVGVTSATALLWHVQNEVIGLEETAEVPLMSGLFLALVWHVRRRASAVRAAQRLAESEHRMREMQRRFVRFASHELRTPVTVARGFTELIRDAPANSQISEDADVVLDELDKLEGIAGRLLSLARADERTTLKLCAVNIDTLLERSITRWRATAIRDWRLSRCAEVLVADPGRLETALDSLMENAVRYTDRGGVICLSACRDGESVVIEVRDDGHGIPANELPFVFEGFRSGPVGGGTGMGLAIVKAIVEAHGGAVSAENTVDGGAAFRLRLPLRGPHRSTYLHPPDWRGQVELADQGLADREDPAGILAALRSPYPTMINIVYPKYR